MTGAPRFDVLIEDDGWGRHIGDAQAVCEQALRLTLPQNADTEVSFLFTSDEAIRKLNADYRGKDQPTNVLSFPMVQIAADDPFPPMLGDVIMARQTVQAEAEQLGITMHDHIMHLLIHGLLHLTGHDHEDDDEAEMMEAKERELLASIGIADPYEVTP
ncbi:MAG: rRNA maturation RNase YbeY [Pseudomonadota bacterium]